LRVVLGFHLVAMVPLGVLAIATNALAPLGWSQIPFFVLLGAVGWLSYLAFYGALAIGPISVVSPIVSGYAAVTVLLAVVVSGEHLDLAATVAVVVTIAGVMVCCTDLRQIRGVALERRAALGLVLALVAMALIGGFVFGVADRHRALGWLAPIFLARGFATLFLLGHGAVDTGGYVCFNLGVEHAATAIVATASAPYALVPIAAGVLLLGERPTVMQRAGVLLVIGGLVLLGVTR
jgi:drug/metabolite transporter (DMT)-like permease